MAITVDTIQLKFNVKPSYEQQEIQKMNASGSTACNKNTRKFQIDTE